MARTFWFAAGAGAAVYAMNRARKLREAVTADGLRDRASGLALGARMFRDEVAQGRGPLRTVAIREEVALLAALHRPEGGQPRHLLGGRPGERDGPPYAEVVAEMGIVDRDHRVERGQHPQQPCAPAARGPEDPSQPVLPLRECEARLSHALSPCRPWSVPIARAVELKPSPRTSSIGGCRRVSRRG